MRSNKKVSLKDLKKMEAKELRKVKGGQKDVIIIELIGEI